MAQIHAGYRCADLLVRLPGHIPLPSFFSNPPLPAFNWVDVETRRMTPEVEACLSLACGAQQLLPSLPYPISNVMSNLLRKPGNVGGRKVIQAPLLVRPPSSKESVYTPEGRSQLLSSIGVPPHLHDPTKTKILIVSFGGQVFKRPQTPSKTHSRNASRESVTNMPSKSRASDKSPSKADKLKTEKTINEVTTKLQAFQNGIPTSKHFDLNFPLRTEPASGTSNIMKSEGAQIQPPASPRLATPCHLWIPGAPPASKPPMSPSLLTAPTIPILNTIPPTPQSQTSSSRFPDPDSMYLSSSDASESSSASSTSDDEVSLASESLTTPGDEKDNDEELLDEMDIPKLLPDASWIAIVCGVSKEQWAAARDGEDSELPEEFYVAPRDVYMPDLTAVGDVLLGKLVRHFSFNL